MLEVNLRNLYAIYLINLYVITYYILDILHATYVRLLTSKFIR